jgi:AcrR family transcriptional regulator
MPIDSLKLSRVSGEGTDKRQEILDVAATFFLSYGFEGASVNAMARHSGISKESFYRYFRGKDELFTAVIDQELAQYHASIQGLREHWDEEDVRTTLEKMAGTMLSVIMTDRQQALRKLVFAQVHRDPEIGAHYWQIGPGLAYGTLESYFALHAADTDFDPRFLARAFLALLLHEKMLARSLGVRKNPTREEMIDHAETTVKLFLKAYFRNAS